MFKIIGNIVIISAADFFVRHKIYTNIIYFIYVTAPLNIKLFKLPKKSTRNFTQNNKYS